MLMRENPAPIALARQTNCDPILMSRDLLDDQMRCSGSSMVYPTVKILAREVGMSGGQLMKILRREGVLWGGWVKKKASAEEWSKLSPCLRP